MRDPIPADLRALFDGESEPDEMLGRLVELYGRSVRADRCLLFLYRQREGLSRCSHAWQARPEWALHGRAGGWRPLPPDLAARDPMFASALVDPEALFVEDVASADAARVDAAYEREHFGHRALIHAPLLEDGVLHGILEPCTMAAPRSWSDRDRAVTAWTQRRLLPVVKRYLAGE